MESFRLRPADWMKDVLKANYACARDPRAAWIPADAPSCEVGGTRETGVNETRVSSIPPQVLRQKMASSNPPVLVDVRETEELSGELGRIEGIVHIPVGALAFRLAELDPHKGREMVTVCRSGARAGTAAQILAKAGFPRVSVLAGGMLAWNAMR
jgi:sulfur dioxygenase